MTHNEAMEEVEKLAAQRRRDGKSLKWFKEAIEALEFFDDGTIWEILEAFG